jgi:hypothetical protein
MPTVTSGPVLQWRTAGRAKPVSLLIAGAANWADHLYASISSSLQLAGARDVASVPCA